jgi:hypothetical protein
MSEKRFARQHIYEPPPEFPLASPCTGIVHHLSGPNRYARTQTFRRSSWSVDGAGCPSHQSQVTCASWVYHPPTRIHVGLLGPCFKTGRLEVFCQHLDDAVPKDRAPFTPWSTRRHRRGTNPAVIPAGEPMLTST